MLREVSGIRTLPDEKTEDSTTLSAMFPKCSIKETPPTSDPLSHAVGEISKDMPMDTSGTGPQPTGQVSPLDPQQPLSSKEIRGILGQLQPIPQVEVKPLSQVVPSLSMENGAKQKAGPSRIQPQNPLQGNKTAEDTGIFYVEGRGACAILAPNNLSEDEMYGELDEQLDRYQAAAEKAEAELDTAIKKLAIETGLKTSIFHSLEDAYDMTSEPLNASCVNPWAPKHPIASAIHAAVE